MQSTDVSEFNSLHSVDNLFFFPLEFVWPSNPAPHHEADLELSGWSQIHFYLWPVIGKSVLVSQGHRSLGSGLNSKANTEAQQVSSDGFTINQLFNWPDLVYTDLF